MHKYKKYKRKYCMHKKHQHGGGDPRIFIGYGDWDENWLVLEYPKVIEHIEHIDDMSNIIYTSQYKSMEPPIYAFPYPTPMSECYLFTMPARRWFAYVFGDNIYNEVGMPLHENIDTRWKSQLQKTIMQQALQLLDPSFKQLLWDALGAQLGATQPPSKPTPKPAQPTPKPAQPTPKPAQPTPKPAQPTPKPAQPILPAHTYTRDDVIQMISNMKKVFDDKDHLGHCETITECNQNQHEFVFLAWQRIILCEDIDQHVNIVVDLNESHTERSIQYDYIIEQFIRQFIRIYDKQHTYNEPTTLYYTSKMSKEIFDIEFAKLLQ